MVSNPQLKTISEILKVDGMVVNDDPLIDDIGIDLA
jgi:hypothetical protein